MSVIVIKGERRERTGKGGARKARAAGFIPGVLYGQGVDPIALSVNSREFETSLRQHKGGNAIFNLTVDGAEYASLVREVQYDPLNHDILHLDFQYISLDEEVTVKIAVHLTGTAVGVKEGGGILEGIMREVEVRCLPTAIPGSIDIDVSHLNIGESIHVRDLSVPNATILSHRDDTIATVVPPTVMEEKPAEEVAAEAAAEGEGEPEVIAKGKKEEEEDAAEAKDKDKEKKDKKE